jgi:hypothetical protein
MLSLELQRSELRAATTARSACTLEWYQRTIDMHSTFQGGRVVGTKPNPEVEDRR